MKKYFKLKNMLIFASIVVMLLIGIICYAVSTDKYNAVYFTSKESSILDIMQLKHKDILEVNSLKELKSKVKSINDNIGIIIDKSELQDGKDIEELNSWLIQQKKCPIIVVGYGNPTYVYFKKLIFTDEKKIPKLSKEKYDEFKKENGFSFAYIADSGKIYGNGYKDETNLNRIMKIVNKALKGEEQVKEIMTEGKNNE